MPRPIRFALELHGFDETADRLGGVADRLKEAHGAWGNVETVLEAGHERHFKRLRGRYVRTGRLRDSLTGVSPHSIREVHADGAGLDFGTSVFYARFLTKRRKDPNDGQQRARRRKGKSAVLVMTPATRKQVSRSVLDFLTEPWE